MRETRKDVWGYHLLDLGGFFLYTDGFEWDGGLVERG